MRDISLGMKRYGENGLYIRGIRKSGGILLHEFDLPTQYQFPMLLQHVHHCKKDKYIFVFLHYRNFRQRILFWDLMKIII